MHNNFSDGGGRNKSKTFRGRVVGWALYLVNGAYGIDVTEYASPGLRENVCLDNKSYGI